MKNLNIKSYVIAGVLLLATSCSEEYLEPTVSTAKPVDTSVNNGDDLSSLVKGAYDRMNTISYYGRNFIVYQEARSDNAFSNGNSGRFVTIGQLAYSPNNGYVIDTWAQIYAVIANANIVINAEIEEESTEASQARGEAYAIRALAYMDLLRTYGQEYTGGSLGVPLITNFSSDNPYPSRATVEEVWGQIGSDLEMAISNMDPSVTANNRFSLWSAYALQSRYYLYTQQYGKAAIAAKKVIDSGAYSLRDAGSYLGSWAGQGGDNTIFQLAFTGADNLSFNSLYFIYQPTTYGDIEVTDDLYTLYEPGDVRQGLYSVNGPIIRMTGKYPSVDYTDNIKVIRYAEVVLNYAEALIRTNAPDALAYLNMIPSNRNATLYTEATVDNVLLERRKELAMEGQRFFDLMRNGKGIPYVDPGQTFGSADVPFGSSILAFPIPQTEISANPNIKQNDGY